MRGSLWRGAEDATFLHAWRKPPGIALDLGCGDGKFLAGLAAAGYQTVGLDFSHRALVLAQGRVTAKLAQGDLRDLPFKTGSIDVVGARFALGALLGGQREEAGNEIERVVAPGGIALVEEFGYDDFRFGNGQEVEQDTFERNRGITTHYFDADEAPELLPSLKVVHRQELRGAQRTDEGERVRHRWRWILRRETS